MAQQFRAQIRRSKPQAIREIVQHALREAATAATPNGAIDVLGDALLELERLVERRRVRAH
jgi:hypothetical protein